ncbi:MAG: hypothetical protein JNM88_17760 [Chitinophagaceae bacterium]|nr:hypothetical protein [Chitinophagaceae bacterium]
MRYCLFLILAVATLVTACNKDKFTTTPQVKIKSISPSEVFFSDIIRMQGSFTDEEGDVDSVLIVYKWYNGSTAIPRDTFRYKLDVLNVPDKTRQADIEVTFEYHTNNNPDLRFLPSVLKDTNATFGLILKDKDGNRSEYAESDQIRLKNN